MHAARLPISLHRSMGGATQHGVLPEGTATTAPRDVGRLGARDHRDDGSAIGGLLIGIGAGILVWALVATLFVLLLW